MNQPGLAGGMDAMGCLNATRRWSFDGADRWSLSLMRLGHGCGISADGRRKGPIVRIGFFREIPLVFVVRQR
jgi:hypothetical protein